jgi:hypothetical protein
MGLVALAVMVALELHHQFLAQALHMLAAAAVVVEVEHHRAALAVAEMAHTMGQAQQAELQIPAVVAVAHRQ